MEAYIMGACVVALFLLVALQDHLKKKKNGPGLTPRPRDGPPVLLGPEFDTALEAAARGDLGPVCAVLESIREVDGFSDHDLMLSHVGKVLRPEVVRAARGDEPDEPMLALLLGASHAHTAWLRRGSAPAEDTTEAQFAAFHQHLEAARAALEDAATLAPEWPSAWALMLPVAVGLGADLDERRDIIDRVWAIDPAHVPTASYGMMAFGERWGGSNAEVEGFAAEVRSRAPAGSPLEAVWVDLLGELAVSAMDAPALRAVVDARHEQEMRTFPTPEQRSKLRVWAGADAGLHLFHLWRGRAREAAEHRAAALAWIARFR